MNILLSENSVRLILFQLGSLLHPEHIITENILLFSLLNIIDVLNNYCDLILWIKLVNGIFFIFVETTDFVVL